jgi:outer membrane receptor protein involved in Fe transport
VRIKKNRPRVAALGLAFVIATYPAVAMASSDTPTNAEADAEDSADAGSEIIVYGRGIPLIGEVASASTGVVGYLDFEQKPISRAGELAENVPGVIATQHSGEGKANQFFLRGFNLDHGTDFAGFIDGSPINMRTHGHGQGYLDLNFLIPELIERIDYTKGTHNSALGDFSAAGSITFTTKSKLDAPIAELTLGSFDYVRGLLAGSTEVAGGELLGGFEGTFTNGPFVLDGDVEKFSGILKYSRGTAERGFSLGISGYDISYTSSDQIPERAVRSGLIDRFGFIDDTLGGRTSRYALNFQRNTKSSNLSLYAIRYRFFLTSNFTYFLDDPINGDQFQQRDQREIYGGAAKKEWALGDKATIRIGGDTRYDHIGKVGLYRSTAGIQRSIVRQDKVDEYSVGGFAEAEVAVLPNVRVVAGLRADTIGYKVNAELDANSGRGSDSILSPKFSLAWKPLNNLELYANYGESFHSNDVRGATITIDPASGDPADRVPVIARARGAELGARFERNGIVLTATGYYLTLASELVFVGDAGTTEPNDASRRYGAELSLFWRPLDWLTLDGAATYSNARFRGVAPGQRRIPGSLSNTLAGGVNAKLGGGFAATARVRHFGSGPLIEDGSVRSDSTTLVNVGGYFERGRIRLNVDVFNIFDANDPDITYFYASRLPGEPAEGVEDRHFHPVEPRQVRVTARISF